MHTRHANKYIHVLFAQSSVPTFDFDKFDEPSARCAKPTEEGLGGTPASLDRSKLHKSF